MTLFAASGLAASRGGRRLFEGVAFAINPGGALVLVGPNGAGKSSLLRLLAGFGRPTAGRITWDGDDITADLDEYRGRLQILGHADAVKPALRVDELLGFWIALSGASATPARIATALAAMGLERLAATPCRFLSAGQRRRLALARLAAYDRPLWLLDEPSVGLDVDSIALLSALIAGHRERGGMVILSTHQDLGLDAGQRLSLADYPPRDDDSEWWAA